MPLLMDEGIYSLKPAISIRRAYSAAVRLMAGSRPQNGLARARNVFYDAVRIWWKLPIA
jgi:hypothetical protein